MTESSGATSTLLPSSTPIRISGGGGGSFHGVHASGLGGESSPVAGSGPHSSSVPTLGLATAQVPLQLPPSVQTGTAVQPPTVSTGGSSSTPPSSAGLRQVGTTSWTTDGRDNRDSQAEKTPPDSSKLNRKESYKAQRQNYRREKKRVALELVNSLQDPAVILLADWLKIRGTLKSWTKLWCVLKPGLLLIYKSPKTKSGHWVGTVMLNSCQVIERPSKKDGFCFKVFHPLEQTIWATRGPDRETIGAVVQPLPTAYLIFRAPSQAAGKCWMDALELSLRCSALLLRSSSNSSALQSTSAINDVGQSTHETQWSEADYEKHFNENDFDADSQNEGGVAAIIMSPESDSDSEVAEAELHQKQQKHQQQQHEQLRRSGEQELEETPYVATDEDDFFQQTGEHVEELAEENKSLIWMMLKQVRPGMDLSKVVLPTFILEPRSFLDKLSDSYYHADILSNAVTEDDPFNRMKLVVQWYLSSFYKRPKGLKKPYNPILGEVFRCYWQHDNGSRTFFIAEQVSHHPPISAFYVTNREDGFCISCSIVAKSKFYGNSTSAVLEGVATLTLLPRGESYTMTTPYAHCKGILMGKLSMELGGKVSIECENTGYKTDIEFKLKPFLGGNESTNMVAGKIKLGKETLATISGYWDGKMMFYDTKTNEETVLFAVDEDSIASRLTRYVVPLEEQQIYESQRLWYLVSEAIKADNQEKATAEKTVLEESQRMSAVERKENFIDWVPKLFHPDLITDQWVYKHADMRPWDRRNDLKQYESGFRVLTQKRTQLKAPMIRAGSVVVPRVKVIRKNKTDEQMSDSSLSDERPAAVTSKPFQQLTLAIEIANKTLENHTRQLAMINKKLDRALYRSPSETLTKQISQSSAFSLPHSVPQSTAILWMLYMLLALFVTLILRWILNRA